MAVKKGKSAFTNCDLCCYFNVDEETGLHVCRMALDEDEMLHFLKGKFYNCPYYKPYDEYGTVRKQN